MGAKNWRRAAQSAAGCLLLAYGTLLLYQAGASVSVRPEHVVLPRVQGQSNEVQVPVVAVTPPPPATATPRPVTTTLSDLFISVKTTRHYHDLRLPIILKTWFQLARDQIWFFTDADSHIYQAKTNGHMINTNCSSSHNRKALCCKMAVEFDVFLESDKKWFCHFDDDNYVNVPRLVRLLQDYSPKLDWYLGKPSIQAPLQIVNRDNTKQKISFWFATGGAGFCISRALASKMMPLARVLNRAFDVVSNAIFRKRMKARYTTSITSRSRKPDKDRVMEKSGGKFISIGDKIRLPDDVTMGYIIEHLLGKPLTVVDQFHSHLEPMKFLRRDTLNDQVSFSFSKNKDEWNVVNVDGFDENYDKNRFLSLHCFLFPYFSFCPR